MKLGGWSKIGGPMPPGQSLKPPLLLYTMKVVSVAIGHQGAPSPIYSCYTI